jgi:serine/threonine-protein kinase RsbW
VISLRVPATLPHREMAMGVVLSACRVAAHVRDAAGLPPLEPGLGELVVSAVGEAFNNVVFHAYRGRSPGDVAIEIDITPRGLTVRVVDFGSAFDPTAVPEPELDGLPESGMGLFIMRRCMDAVRYVPGPPNALVLEKKF